MFALLRAVRAMKQAGEAQDAADQSRPVPPGPAAGDDERTAYDVRLKSHERAMAPLDSACVSALSVTVAVAVALLLAVFWAICGALDLAAAGAWDQYGAVPGLQPADVAQAVREAALERAWAWVWLGLAGVMMAALEAAPVVAALGTAANAARFRYAAARRWIRRKPRKVVVT